MHRLALGHVFCQEQAGPWTVLCALLLHQNTDTSQQDVFPQYAMHPNKAGALHVQVPTVNKEMYIFSSISLFVEAFVLLLPLAIKQTVFRCI